MFEWFEPSLEHHREEFQRLGRRQVQIVLALPVCITILAVLVGVLYPGHLTEPLVEWALLAFVFLGIGSIGFLEIKKAMVFRKDLHERRHNSEGGSPDRP